MKIGILSFRPHMRSSAPEDLMLMREARALGHKSQIYRSTKFQMVYDQKSPSLYYNGKPFKKCDVMIMRPYVLRNADLQISLIEQLELMGVPLFNKYDPILKAKNKIKTMQILDYYGVPIPKTVVVRRPEDIEQAAKFVGRFPLIVKTPFGSFGNGVTIIESMRALKSYLRWRQPLYLFQEFVKHSNGKDIRVIVVNGKVVGTMMRSAQKGEFRSNIELGGIGSPVEITDEEATIAIRCVQALNLNYGGVDIMRSKKGPLVLEVNANPGFKALVKATGANVAREIVKYAQEFGAKHK